MLHGGKRLFFVEAIKPGIYIREDIVQEVFIGLRERRVEYFKLIVESTPKSTFQIKILGYRSGHQTI